MKCNIGLMDVIDLDNRENRRTMDNIRRNFIDTPVRGDKRIYGRYTESFEIDIEKDIGSLPLSAATRDDMRRIGLEETYKDRGTVFRIVYKVGVELMNQLVCYVNRHELDCECMVSETRLVFDIVSEELIVAYRDRLYSGDDKEVIYIPLHCKKIYLSSDSRL